MALPTPSLALTVPADPTFSESLQFQTVGLAVVLSTLVAIWIILELTGMFFRRRQRLQKPIRHSPSPSQAAAPSLTHREIAAIAAAVHATIKGPFHILSVQQHDDMLRTKLNPQQQAWSVEGRRAIFSSHRIR